MSLRDLDLLLFGVAGKMDDLETVPQCRRNRIHDVGRGDEEHLREVEGQIEIVIPERIVLLGVENLEQRRARIAAHVVAELVDLVEHEYGIFGLRPAEALNDLAW